MHCCLGDSLKDYISLTDNRQLWCGWDQGVIFWAKSRCLANSIVFSPCIGTFSLIYFKSETFHPVCSVFILPPVWNPICDFIYFCFALYNSAIVLKCEVKLFVLLLWVSLLNSTLLYKLYIDVCVIGKWAISICWGFFITLHKKAATLIGTCYVYNGILPSISSFTNVHKYNCIQGLQLNITKICAAVSLTWLITFSKWLISEF